MASNIIKLDYEQGEVMIQKMNDMKAKIEEVGEGSRNVAGQLSGGALLGRGGDAFVDAIGSKLMPALERLAFEFGKGADYIRTEIEDMKAAEQQSGQLFQ